MKILSIITHPHVVPNLYDLRLHRVTILESITYENNVCCSVSAAPQGYVVYIVYIQIKE